MGGGQLGMMLIREAQRMGYRSCALDPAHDCPAARVADRMLAAPYNDTAALQKLAALSNVITYEFENVDLTAVQELELLTPLVPCSAILATAQNRKLEKLELERKGFHTARWLAGTTRPQLGKAIDGIGLPCVAKTTTAGYDGKGQSVLRSDSEVMKFLGSHDGEREYIVEEFLDLQCELSVIAARGSDGTVITFPVCENEHRDNILHITRAPARVSEELRVTADAIGRAIIQSFNMVGLLCVEMFVTPEWEILVNELAPRPHNSGHYTLDACSMSQFEALIRAMCGLPLFEPRLLSPCAMVNILGKHLERLDIPALLRMEGLKLHLYGKTRFEPKRKMGHVTIVRETQEEAENCLLGLTINFIR